MTQPRNVGKQGRPTGGYDVAFKRHAVALVEERGRGTTEVSRELGITPVTLLLWRKQYGRAQGVAATAPKSIEGLEAENARLRAEVERLHLREEVLKKTLGILSDPSGSVTPGSKL
jgi:transposase-like protein